MYDCHYDLLTYIYMNRKNLDEVKKYCKNIFNNNLKGGIFNLFYMSESEMQEELEIKLENINIIENLKTVKEIIKSKNIIPKNINYIIGIEGLDYLKNLEDMNMLYELGVRAVNPVWNNHNKFGTGVRPTTILNGKKGLTNLGKQLIYKLIKTKIAIDISHTDEQTFWDIIEVCKKNINLKPKLFASHSNCKAICDASRNLTDSQIIEIKRLGGIIGVVSIKQFCSLKEDSNFEEEYIKHIKHIKELSGNVDNIVLATDDMSYYITQQEYYHNMNIFKQEKVKNEIIKLLNKNDFKEEEINKIMRLNFLNFFKFT